MSAIVDTSNVQARTVPGDPDPGSAVADAVDQARTLVAALDAEDPARQAVEALAAAVEALG